MKKTNATAPDSQQFVRVAGWFETFTAAADGESGIKELRCDLFSINSLAAAMHVRKAEARRTRTYYDKTQIDQKSCDQFCLDPKCPKIGKKGGSRERGVIPPQTPSRGKSCVGRVR